MFIKIAECSKKPYLSLVPRCSFLKNTSVPACFPSGYPPMRHIFVALRAYIWHVMSHQYLYIYIDMYVHTYVCIYIYICHVMPLGFMSTTSTCQSYRSCLDMPCDGMSCHVLQVISCHAMLCVSYHVMSCHGRSCHAHRISFHAMSHNGMSCHACRACHVMSCHVHTSNNKSCLAWHVISCHVIARMSFHGMLLHGISCYAMSCHAY